MVHIGVALEPLPTNPDDRLCFSKMALVFFFVSSLLWGGGLMDCFWEFIVTFFGDFSFLEHLSVFPN
jgi:hypothetical protein